MSELPPLLTATSIEDTLRAVAGACWYKNHDGESCPADKIPSESELAVWFHHFAPTKTGEEADGLLSRTYDGAFVAWKLICALDPDTKEVTPLLFAGIFRHRLQTGTTIFPRSQVPQPTLGQKVEKAGEFVGIANVQERWLSIPEDQRPPHPLAPIIHAWQEQPPTATPESRKDRRILTTVRATESRAERQRGELFGGLIDGRTQGELPLFEAIPVRKAVPILDIADASGIPVMAQGRGAPLPARLFVRTGLSVKPEDRNQETIRMAITVRELRDGLYPNGWRIGQHWPELKTALLGARDYTIRLPDGGRWFMLALRRLPSEDRRGRPDLDDCVILDFAFPPGASSGPTIELATLDQLSIESAPRWRAYIAGHALTWKPGKTRRRMPAHGGRFTWSRDPADYPILTVHDRLRLAFGEQNVKHRTKAEIDAPWRDLPGLVVIEQAMDQRTGEIGWRVMPADSVRNEQASLDQKQSFPRLRNRGKRSFKE